MAALLGRAFEAESRDAAGTERELFCDERRRLANSALRPTGPGTSRASGLRVRQARRCLLIQLQRPNLFTGQVAPMISRRRFLSAASISILATSRAAEAQPARRVWRLGALDVVSMASNAANLEAFRQGLRELGYVEGQDFVIEYRSADGQAERFPGLVTELLRLNVDVIVTRGTPAVSAAKQKTSTTPIVMASSGDPVGSGVVASLARPGGNVTGLSALATEIQDKQLEVLKEVRPGIARVGFLFNMANPVMHPQWKYWGRDRITTRSSGPAQGSRPLTIVVMRPPTMSSVFEASI